MPKNPKNCQKNPKCFKKYRKLVVFGTFQGGSPK